MVTAVILAGGKSSRMGRDKLMLALGDETLLESAARRFSASFGRVLVSVADGDKYPDIKIPRVVDIHPGLGPVSGLHAALLASPGGVFLTAADMPFACPDAAKRIITLGRDYDACVIRHPGGKLEPLFSYCGTALLPECERAIGSRRHNMAPLFEGVNTLYISPRDLGELWNDTLLLNVNNPGDYEKIQKLGPRA